MSGDSFPMPEGVSEKLLEILKCALAFEPERRYEDPYAMLKALWEYCGDEPEEIKRIPAASPAPEPEPEKKPEKKPEPKPAPKPKQEKPAPKQETPKPQTKAADKAPAPVKPVRTIHERRAEKRSAIALAAILLLLVGVGLARSSVSFNAPSPVVQTRQPVSEHTAAPSAEPTKRPEPSKAPADVQYMLYSEDVSWQEAEDSCRELGGHLATIKDEADYDKLCQLLADCTAQYVWIGAYRAPDGRIKWVDGQNHDFYAWAQGEPSMTDSYDGAEENYVMLVKQPDGTWLYNDSRENPMAQYSSFYSGKLAYICQVG